PKSVGLANYAALFSDPDFWNALKVTVLYVLWNIPIQTVLALLVAVVMNAASRSNLLRAVFLLPWLMPNVVVALLWMWLLDPSLGIINETIRHLGGRMVPFLSSTALPLLRPVLAFVLVTSIIGSFQIFDTVAVTTNGGPVNATKVFNFMIYQQAFQRFRMGYSTSVSMVLFLLLVGVGILQMRLLRAREAD